MLTTFELSKYLILTDDEILQFDLMKWWCEHQNIFPLLARFARSVYCIPATAAQIKRVWSAGGLASSYYK